MVNLTMATPPFGGRPTLLHAKYSSERSALLSKEGGPFSYLIDRIQWRMSNRGTATSPTRNDITGRVARVTGEVKDLTVIIVKQLVEALIDKGSAEVAPLPLPKKANLDLEAGPLAEDEAWLDGDFSGPLPDGG
jgi:hypothetical protein